MNKNELDIEQFASIKDIYDFCFSKDDKWIFYVANLGEYSGIWAVPVEGGHPRQVSFIQDGDVKALKISPDGKLLAFFADYGGKENFNIFVMPAYGGKSRNLTKDLQIPFPSSAWSPDNLHIALAAVKDGFNNIVKIDIESGNYEWLTDSPDIKMGVEWSYDGNWIAYTSYREQLRSDIMLLDPRTKKIINITKNLKGENTSPKFSPDGKIVAFTSDADGIKNVFFTNLNDFTITKLEKQDSERSFIRWNPTGDKFIFLHNQDAQLNLYESSYPPDKTCLLTQEIYTCSDAYYAESGNKIALRASTPTMTGEIYVREGENFRQLTSCAPLSFHPDLFVKPEKIRYPSFDNLEIPALYYKPKNITNYPALIWIHGGPTSQHLNSWAPYIQFFVINGIAVLAPNIRGSTGYGREFENKVSHDWGGGDLQDVIYGAEFLKNDPKVDQSRIMVAGGSYGGYMTMMAVTKYPHIWACGINWMGPVNLETFYRESRPWLRAFLKEKYNFLPPEEDPEFYYDRSSINFIDKISCPILIIYGKNDPRVPIHEMQQLKEKLQHYNKIFEEEIFEEEGHTRDRYKTRLLIYTRMLEFIRKYVLKVETGTMSYRL